MLKKFLNRLKPFEVLLFLFLTVMFLVFFSVLIDKKSNSKLLTFIYKNQENHIETMTSVIESALIQHHILLEKASELYSLKGDQGLLDSPIFANKSVVVFSEMGGIIYNTTPFKFYPFETSTTTPISFSIQQIETEWIMAFYFNKGNIVVSSYQPLSSMFENVFGSHQRFVIYDKLTKRLYTNEYVPFIRQIDTLAQNQNISVTSNNIEYLITTLPFDDRILLSIFAPQSEYLEYLHQKGDGKLGFTGLAFGITILILLILLKNYIVRYAFEKEKYEKLFFLEQEKFQRIVEAIGEGVALIDVDYNLIWCNEYVKTSVPNYEGEKCYKVLAGKDTPCWGCKFNEVIALKKNVHMTFSNYIHKKEGHFEIVLSPLLDEDGTVVAVVDLIRDVTESVELNKKILQSEKLSALGLLAGGIAHEINNPLVGILNFAQLLSKKLPEGTSESKLAHTIVEAGTETKKIVQNLLTYARQNVDKKEMYDLNESIYFALKILGSRIKQKQIQVIGLESKPFMVMANKGKMHQVFLNLLNNSLDASNKNGIINVELEHLSTKQTVKITDYGIGICEDNIQLIFDPFFTTKEVGKGTGLGLSIIAGIINDHGWKIDVQSIENEYTCFTIEIEELELKEG